MMRRLYFIVKDQSEIGDQIYQLYQSFEVDQKWVAGQIYEMVRDLWPNFHGRRNLNLNSNLIYIAT